MTQKGLHVQLPACHTGLSTIYYQPKFYQINRCMNGQQHLSMMASQEFLQIKTFT